MSTHGSPSDSSVVERVRRRLSADAAEPTALTVAEALRAEHQVAGSGTVLQIVDQLRSETRGAGVLDPLLALPGVTDVLVNGAEQVHVDCGRGLERVPLRFDDDDAVRRLAQRLAAQAGRRLDESKPAKRIYTLKYEKR